MASRSDDSPISQVEYSTEDEEDAFQPEYVVCNDQHEVCVVETLVQLDQAIQQTNRRVDHLLDLFSLYVFPLDAPQLSHSCDVDGVCHTIEPSENAQE